MLVLVPEPVWKTSTGNWSSQPPSATSLGGRGDGGGTSSSRRPARALTSAAAALISGQRPDERRRRPARPEIGKFSTARWVWAPQRASPAPAPRPCVSCSIRNSPSCVVASAMGPVYPGLRRFAPAALQPARQDRDGSPTTAARSSSSDGHQVVHQPVGLGHRVAGGGHADAEAVLQAEEGDVERGAVGDRPHGAQPLDPAPRDVDRHGQAADVRDDQVPPEAEAFVEAGGRHQLPRHRAQRGPGQLGQVHQGGRPDRRGPSCAARGPPRRCAPGGAGGRARRWPGRRRRPT